MASLKGLARGLQTDTSAGSNNQYTHNPNLLTAGEHCPPGHPHLARLI